MKKMTRANTKADRAAPLWAVFGAPLVGVPLMVALLAFGSAPVVDPVDDSDPGFITEQVQMPELEGRADLAALHID